VDLGLPKRVKDGEYSWWQLTDGYSEWVEPTVESDDGNTSIEADDEGEEGGNGEEEVEEEEDEDEE
jgi:hypothetical protein